MNILVYVESRGGKIRGAGLEALTVAGQLSRKSGGSLSALLIGSNANDLASQLEPFGPAKVFVADAPELAVLLDEVVADDRPGAAELDPHCRTPRTAGTAAGRGSRRAGSASPGRRAPAPAHMGSEIRRCVAQCGFG